MQKGLFAWLLFAAISVIDIPSYGQSFPYAPLAELLVVFGSDSVSFNPADSLSTYVDDTIAITLLVSLPEGPDPTKIHVKVGGSEGDSDLMEKIFIYDGPANQGPGVSYARTGRNLFLGIGTFFGVAAIHARVWLEYSNGILSPARTATLKNQ